jgi:hypothetical protein
MIATTLIVHGFGGAKALERKVKVQLSSLKIKKP